MLSKAAASGYSADLTKMDARVMGGDVSASLEGGPERIPRKLGGVITAGGGDSEGGKNEL